MSRKLITPLIAVCVFASAISAYGQKLKVQVFKEVHHDVSKPLREMTPAAPKLGPPREKSKPKPIPVAPSAGAVDPVVQTTQGPFAGTSVGGFEGVGLANYAVNAAPPDTNGSVGATQYVQWVNEAYAVFDKATGAILLGPINGNTLWSGFGGPCEANNDGDPIAQYDKAANRWVMTQFSVTGGIYFQCIAVSTTSDATGAYNRYAFQYTAFNDYPKFGVWPDGYYATYNMFQNGQTFIGSMACAFDRAKMLAGQAATQQCFQLSSSFGGLLPADLDGSAAPPAGAPNYFVNFGTNSLRVWQFHVDWTTPANSTFTGPTTIAVAAFTTACSGGTCIPQPSTTQKLDSLADRLMYRLAYRNTANGETLLVNHSVKTGGTTKNPINGVRWYELRKAAGATNYSVFQQGSYAPSSASRWMGSIAMDKFGNIAVGYSISSGSIFPSIRFAGRTPTDAAGTLGTEVSILSGSGSQQRSLSRWGDYSNMSVDPVDDCTMYYTTEYLASSGTFNWHTFVGKIKLPNCL